MTALALLLAAAALVHAGGSPSGQDPRAVFLAPGVRSSVPLADILSGGPPVDGIPALVRPRRLSAAEADKALAPDAPVLGLASGSAAVAYPVALLNWHEIVDDEVDGVPVAVTYCPLCRSGIAFDRRSKDGTLDFGVSGLLYKSDLLMYDRGSRSLWSQLLGEAVAGPATGRKLRRLPLERTTWDLWWHAHPAAEAVGFDTGYERDYRRDPYAGYADTPKTFFPVPPPDPRLRPKAVVYGVVVGGVALAVPVSAVAARGTVHGRAGGADVAFKRDGGVRAFVADGAELPGTEAYWFAWAAFYPKTALVGAGQ